MARCCASRDARFMPVSQRSRSSAIPLTLAAKMHRRLLQHSRNSELFRGSSFAGLQIAEGAELLHGDGANRRCGD